MSENPTPLCLCVEPHWWAPGCAGTSKDGAATKRALLERLDAAKTDPVGTLDYPDGTPVPAEIVTYMVTPSELDLFISLVAGLPDREVPSA